MSKLELVVHSNPLSGNISVEIIETSPDTIAHAVYSIVAATLAERIRKALRDHMDSCLVCDGNWTFRCDEGMHLWSLTPDTWT